MSNPGTSFGTSVGSPEVVEQVVTLVREAERADGFSALNEAASLRLRHHEPTTRDFVAGGADGVIGFGQLVGGPDGTAEAALVVHPDHRRRGLGAALLTTMLAQSQQGLEIWAVQDTAAAAALAAGTGLVAVRELLIMRRPLTDANGALSIEPGPIEPVPTPPGIEIRPFRPGADEEAWLAVNARAFASHPEQGGLTLIDLEQRMGEPWFDPAGFLLATRSGPGAEPPVVGFHWTKQHPDRLGEVYVLGVDPEAGVRGLGRALLAAGLAHLEAVGNTAVLLYVDGSNRRAVELYERAGFAVTSRDVMYAGPNARPARLATMLVNSDPTDPLQEIA